MKRLGVAAELVRSACSVSRVFSRFGGVWGFHVRCAGWSRRLVEGAFTSGVAAARLALIRGGAVHTNSTAHLSIRLPLSYLDVT